jgi:hypothetical protein
MNTNKYSNGMYKTTSKAQDNTYNIIWNCLVNTTKKSICGSVDFDHFTGNVTYSFYWDVVYCYSVMINRKGQEIAYNK